MSPFTVVIPWRPAPTREPAYAFVTDWYARHVPEATVRAIDTADDVFVLSACRNEAVRSVPPGEVVVINDADTFPEVNVLRAAVEAARTSGRVHLFGAPPVRHEGSVYALHHRAEVRAGERYEANAALMERYRAASGDPAAMAQLVGVEIPVKSS